MRPVQGVTLDLPRAMRVALCWTKPRSAAPLPGLAEEPQAGHLAMTLLLDRLAMNLRDGRVDPAVIGRRCWIPIRLG